MVRRTSLILDERTLGKRFLISNPGSQTQVGQQVMLIRDRCQGERHMEVVGGLMQDVPVPL